MDGEGVSNYLKLTIKTVLIDKTGQGLTSQYFNFDIMALNIDKVNYVHIDNMKIIGYNDYDT